MKGSSPVPSLSSVRLSELRSTRAPFLWPGIIPHGLTIVAGRPGVSKSLLTVDLAARVTRGRRWPDEKRKAPKGSVAFLAGEDDPRATILPRFVAARGDGNRVHLLGAAGATAFPLRDELQRLLQQFDEIDNLRLIVIDPLTAYLGGVNLSSDVAVRSVLQPIAAYAQRRKASVVAVVHLNKARKGEPLDRVLGSVGIGGLARAVWLVGESPGGTREARIAVAAKFNYGAPGAFSYRIVNTGQGRGRARQPVLRYDRFGIPLEAADVFGATPTASQAAFNATASDAAVRFLQELFRRRARVPAPELRELLERANVSTRTFYRVKRDAGVVAYKDGTNWYWSATPYLPPSLPVRHGRIPPSERGLSPGATWQ